MCVSRSFFNGNIMMFSWDGCKKKLDLRLYKPRKRFSFGWDEETTSRSELNTSLE